MILLQLIDQRCPPDEDDRGLMWPSTKPGVTRTQPCPGEDVTGMLLIGNMLLKSGKRK